MRFAVLCLALALPLALPLAGPVMAAGGNDDAPPTPTQTSKDCTKAQIRDADQGKCVEATDSRLDDDTRHAAVRELAWAGQPERALLVLASMREGHSDRVLTYLGFAHRKAGRVEEGLVWYDRALARNPDNHLARSYLGQLYVEMAETGLTDLQLAEIRNRGGRGTWAETTLARAIATLQTLNY